MKKLLIVGGTVLVLVALVLILNRQIPEATAIAQGGNLVAAPADASVASIPVDDIVLKDLQGNVVKGADLRGKVVLLDFWATWCEVCKYEIPWLIDFQNKYASRGLVILGVDIDPESKDKIDHYLQTQKFDVSGQKELINYSIVTGEESLGDKFGLDGYPTGVLISKDGHVVKVISGLAEGKNEMINDIESQLQASPGAPTTRQ